jgi:uncharacterized membrane protein YfcA
VSLGPEALIGAALVALLAGFVKGAVGFALPLILVSGLGVIVEPRLAVAGLILPTVVANGIQAMRSGLGDARDSIREHAVYIAVVCVAIIVTAQFVTSIPAGVMYVLLGVPVVMLSAVQLAGRRFHIRPESRRRTEVLIAVGAGMMGGIAGTWGPPTVLYLLALDTPKARQMVVQGVVYGLGAVSLLIGHLRSGLLNAETAPFSAFLLLPALAGMWAGLALGDRLDQQKFRRLTMAVLIVAGLNLIRKGLQG